MYMQRILFILALAVTLFFTADKAYARRDLPGQTSVQFTTGEVDRFLAWKSGGERHYFTSLAFTRTNCNRTCWLYGLDYQIKEYTYENKVIPKAQFTGELGYFIPVVSDKGRNVCFRIGLSALGGFETVNWGTSLLPDGASATNGDSFIYDGGLTAAFDVWLTDRIILLMQVKERTLFGTDAGNFHTQIGLGVRLIIN